MSLGDLWKMSPRCFWSNVLGLVSRQREQNIQHGRRSGWSSRQYRHWVFHLWRLPWQPDNTTRPLLPWGNAVFHLWGFLGRICSELTANQVGSYAKLEQLGCFRCNVFRVFPIVFTSLAFFPLTRWKNSLNGIYRRPVVFSSHLNTSLDLKCSGGGASFFSDVVRNFSAVFMLSWLGIFRFASVQFQI